MTLEFDNKTATFSPAYRPQFIFIISTGNQVSFVIKIQTIGTPGLSMNIEVFINRILPYLSLG